MLLGVFEQVVSFDKDVICSTAYIMSTKATIGLGLKVIALIIIMFFSFSVAGSVSGLQAEPAEEAGALLLPLLIVCFLNTAALTYPIVRSRWSGLRLMAVVFVVFCGVTTILSQIEAAYFMPNIIPAGEIPKLFLIGAIIALIFSPLAVFILGRMRRDTVVEAPNLRLVMPWAEWVWKLAVIAVAYLILYFTFGYFVAWQNPELRQFYSGSTELLGFFAHYRNVLLTDPWLVLLQVLRSLLWVALALPVIRMMKGQWWEAGLAVGLLFAVLMNAQLLLPNPYMPTAVRMSHLVEAASSNFIFGWVLVCLVNRHHASLRDLFQW